MDAALIPDGNSHSSVAVSFYTSCLIVGQSEKLLNVYFPKFWIPRTVQPVWKMKTPIFLTQNGLVLFFGQEIGNCRESNLWEAIEVNSFPPTELST